MVAQDIPAGKSRSRPLVLALVGLAAIAAVTIFTFNLGNFFCRMSENLFVPTEKLVWSDEFDTFDLSVWKHELTMGGGGNWEFEYYTNNRTNSFVKNGTLHIQATLTADTIGEANVRSGFTMDMWGSSPADLCTGNAFYGCSRTSGPNIINPIQSARIRTAESFSFKYGRMEVRAKLPRGDWLWPAIWLLPRHNQYGKWPASGEIDVVESRGNAGSYCGGGNNQVGSTLHWGPYWAQDPWNLTHAVYTLPEGDFSEDFHVFGLIWNEQGIQTYVDDQSNIVLNVSFAGESLWQRGGFDKSPYANPWEGASAPAAAPFDQEFYIIMNLAAGGVSGYWPTCNGKPWSDTSSTASNDFYNAKDQWLPSWTQPSLQVDYIRVYQ